MRLAVRECIKMERKKNGYIHPTRIFKTPDDLKMLWDKFKEDVEQNQSKEWLKIQYVGKDAVQKIDPLKIPLTFEGFKRFARKEVGEIEQYFTNQGGYYDEFIGICRAIKEEIRENQIIGGMLNFFNPSITQRLNNLVDKTEATIKQEQPLFGDDE